MDRVTSKPGMKKFKVTRAASVRGKAATMAGIRASQVFDKILKHAGDRSQ